MSLTEICVAVKLPLTCHANWGVCQQYKTELKVSRRKSPKKVSAATFTCSGEHAIFADKFGDVYVAATAAPEQVTLPEQQNSGPLQPRVHC